MALSNLTSQLKNIPFGSDRPGGGSSGLPSLPGGLPEFRPGFEDQLRIIRTSIDDPMRGGASLFIFAEDDATRISNFLSSDPQGTAFKFKQQNLQKQNPLIESQVADGGFSAVPLVNTQVYNTSNFALLRQVKDSGQGTHVPRAGNNIRDLQKKENKYEYIVSHKGTSLNRLVTLHTLKTAKDPEFSDVFDNFAKLGLSEDPSLIFSYLGGPGVREPEGSTNIYKSTDFKGNPINTKNAPKNQSRPKPEIEYGNFIGVSRYVENNTIPGLFDGLTPVDQVAKQQQKIEDLNRVGDETNKFIANSPQDIGYDPLGVTNRASNIGNLDGSVTAPFSTPAPPSFGQPIPKAPTFQNFRKPTDIDRNGNITNLRQQSSPEFIRPERTPTDFENGINQFNNTMGYNALLSSKANNDLAKFSDLQDFRSKTNSATAKALATTTGYNTGGPNSQGNKIENRIGVGSPGRRPKTARKNFYIPFIEGQDKINMSPIYRKDYRKSIESDGNDTRDLIKFCIETLDNGRPNETTRAHFRAYITNFSDNIGAEWESLKYMGRGENFYTYQGFTRDVSFTFVVAAQSVQEMERIYQKVNYIASTLHPDYQEGTGFMRGSIHRLTIGEYFYRSPGVITSMNITVEDNYPWEIKMNQPELFKAQGKKNNPEKDDRGQMEVPQVLKIQMSFKPIMEDLPQKGLKEPIIVSKKINNNYLDRSDFNWNTTSTQDTTGNFAEELDNVSSNQTGSNQPNTTNLSSQATDQSTTQTSVSTDQVSSLTTTNTNDVNEASSATTTTTQAPPAESWVPGDTVVGYEGTITGILSTVTWRVVRDTQIGYFKGIINVDNGFGGVVEGSLGTNIETTKTITLDFAQLAVN